MLGMDCGDGIIGGGTGGEFDENGGDLGIDRADRGGGFPVVAGLLDEGVFGCLNNFFVDIGITSKLS